MNRQKNFKLGFVWTCPASLGISKEDWVRLFSVAGWRHRQETNAVFIPSSFRVAALIRAMLKELSRRGQIIAEICWRDLSNRTLGRSLAKVDKMLSPGDRSRVGDYLLCSFCGFAYDSFRSYFKCPFFFIKIWSFFNSFHGVTAESILAISFQDSDGIQAWRCTQTLAIKERTMERRIGAQRYDLCTVVFQVF